MNEKPKRRWFAIRLRMLLIVAAVLALPLAWAAYSMNWIRQRHAMLARAGVELPIRGSAWAYTPPKAPAMLRPFGEQAVPMIYLNLNVAERPTKREVADLFPEAYVDEEKLASP